MAHGQSSDDLPVISNLAEFDYQSGTFLEKLVFNNRPIVVAFCILTTIILGYQATKIHLQAGFEKMLPKNHPYVLNYQANQNNLKGLGNNLRVVVAVKDGTIFTPENLKFIEEVNDEIFFIPGVDRNGMKSIFTPNTRWRVVTEQGFEGGPVIPGDYDASPESIAQIRTNIARAGIMGDLVGNDEKSAAIIVPLLPKNPETGERLDYKELSDKLEEIREKYSASDPDKSIHIIGFAKLVGDLIDGLFVVMGFFAVAVVIATALLYWYTRCFRSTVMVIGCTLIAVVWQIGILATLGYELDPFSILVPFLVFAIMMFFPFKIVDWQIYAFMILQGSIAGAVPTATFAAAPEVMQKPELAGLGLAIVMFGQNLGMFIGPILFGKLVENLGWVTAGYCLVPFCLLAFVVGWRLKVR